MRAVESPGTVNDIYRLGDDLCARLPMRDEPADQVRSWLRSEAAASAEFAVVSPFPAPRPMALGEPGHGYPLPWTVQDWLPGTTADRADPSGSPAFAEDLAELVLHLRRADTRGRTFAGAGRGGTISDHDAWAQECLSRSRHLVDVRALRRMWQSLLLLPPPSAHVMSHKDLVPGNVLVRNGRLVAVLDTGGFGPADPSLDLVSAWHLLDHGPRSVLQDRLGCTELEWHRGRAWALLQALGLGWYYEHTNRRMSELGVRTLQRLLEDDS